MAAARAAARNSPSCSRRRPLGRCPTAVRVGSYHEAVQRAAPSVVNIFTSKEIRSPRHPLLNDPLFRRFFGDQLPDEAQRASSLGSGVIVSASGYVLTNHHVVEAADEIEVALADGKKLLAKVVGNDPETDLAVLRVNAENLPAITFGSSDALKVGDVVLAIGNPFGVGQTVTGGIVSALGRTGPGHQHVRELHPDRRARSTRATRAARWSTPAATWWASTPRSSRAPAARWASASRSRCRPRRSCWSRS